VVPSIVIGSLTTCFASNIRSSSLIVP